MKSKRRSKSLNWRPPRSGWWSSNLSPHDEDIRQRWHRRYGRFGRRYATETPEGPSVIDDFRPWDQEYRDELRRETETLAGPRSVLARRVHPDRTPHQSSSQPTRVEDRVFDVEDFLSSNTSPGQPINDPGASSESVLGAASDEVDESMERRYTALEKGKEREGAPPPSSGEEHSIQPPRGRPQSNDYNEAGPSTEHVEHAAPQSSRMTRSLSKAKNAEAGTEAANRLAQARME